MLVVIPDLNVSAVAEDVARWAADYEASPAVIRALAVAAGREGDRSRLLLERALQPVLSRRWLSEHGIHELEPDVPASASAPPSSRGRAADARESRPIWQIFPTEPRNGVIASLLAWLCLLQVVILVIILRV
jgi:hypothetical protein